MNFLNYLLGRKPDAVSLAIEEALALLGEKQFDRAIAVLEEKALAREPENRRALLHLGISHMLKGELATAEEILLPLANCPVLDSESATARIALEKIGKEKAESRNGKTNAS